MSSVKERVDYFMQKAWEIRVAASQQPDLKMREMMLANAFSYETLADMLAMKQGLHRPHPGEKPEGHSKNVSKERHSDAQPFPAKRR